MKRYLSRAMLGIQLLIENRYPADVLLSCINEKLANFAAGKMFGSEKIFFEVTLVLLVH